MRQILVKCAKNCSDIATKFEQTRNCGDLVAVSKQHFAAKSHAVHMGVSKSHSRQLEKSHLKSQRKSPV